MPNWIEELKIGDKVLDGDTVLDVTAVHKLHVVCCDHRKYRKSDGKLVGSEGWHARFIRAATPERLLEIKEERLRAKLRGAIQETRFDKLPTGILRKIVEIIKSEKNENAAP